MVLEMLRQASTFLLCLVPSMATSFRMPFAMPI